ncbi:MAG: hypothetical protein WA628_06570 [Terriglobales bacterium]
MRLRALISSIIGITTGGFCWFLLRHFHQDAGDFHWALWAAQDLLAHRNPYDRALQLYPVPTAFFGLPFLGLRPEVAGAAFYGLSSTLMAFGLSRHGYHRLLVFLAYPYWAGLIAAQWSPLIFASAFFPLLLPATLVKPQLGLPVALTHLTKRGVFACTAVLALSLVLLPRWPWLWVTTFPGYVRFIPLLVLPGPLLALALLRYRERDARLLFLMAAMPQRWFYDPLLLWLIPKSRREILGTVAFSWIVAIWRWYHYPQGHLEVGRWIVLLFYLPMLIVVMARPRQVVDPSGPND